MNLLLSIIFLFLAQVSKKETVHYLYIFDASGSMGSSIYVYSSKEDASTKLPVGKES